MGESRNAQFFPTADNPVPPGGAALFVEPAPGVRVRAAQWRQGRRGTVIILPGRTEFIEKYFETIGALCAREFSVAALDWRGQGASSRALPNPLIGHVGDFAEFMADLEAVLGAVESGLPKPILLLAHSMGGTLAFRALHDWPGRFAGAALTSPMMGLKQVPRPLAPFLGLLMPAQRFVPGGAAFDPYAERFESNPVTHDAKRFARNLGIIKARPELAQGAPSWGWLRAALRSMRLVMRWGYLESIAAPVLILSAAAERIVDNAVHLEAAKRLPRVTQMVVQGARHEILQEVDSVRAEFWRRFDSFAGAFRN